MRLELAQYRHCSEDVKWSRRAGREVLNIESEENGNKIKCYLCFLSADLMSAADSPPPLCPVPWRCTPLCA